MRKNKTRLIFPRINGPIMAHPGGEGPGFPDLPSPENPPFKTEISKILT